MKDFKEREEEARARLAERLAHLRAAHRRDPGNDRRPVRAARAGRPPLPRTQAETQVFWWQQ